jgi:hypothetical protein
MFLAGPTVQYLYSIFLRFRTYQIAFTSGRAKIYRQVEIRKDDRNLLLILWWKSDEELLRTYEQAAVTYGTTSAPYLETCCLQQLAEYESKDFSPTP